MARYSQVQTDFAGGLISDFVLGRTDIKRIANSGRKFNNFFPSLQGPAIYRSGFKYYDDIDVNTDNVQSVNVVLATNQAFRAVFTPNRVDIYDQDGVLKDTVTTPYSDSQIKDLRFSSETDALLVAHGSHLPHKLTADLSFVTQVLTASHDPDGPEGPSQHILQSTDPDPEGGADINRTLAANLEVQGTDSWSFEEVEFDCHPFLEVEDSGNKYNIAQGSRIVKITGFSADLSNIPSAKPTPDHYLEYTIDGEILLGKVLYAADAAGGYTVENPTSTVVYVEPVESVLDIQDDAAQLYLLDNLETPDNSTDITSLDLDGVPDNEIHLRCDTTVFNSGQKGSWVRVSEDRRNNDVVVGFNREKTRWVKIEEHLGASDHPVDFFRGNYDNTLYKAGFVYRIYNGLTTTLYQMGPDSVGDVKITTAVLQPTGNRTYSFVNGLGVAGNHPLGDSNNAIATGVFTIGNLSTQKQFDVVKCDSTAPKIEAYDSVDGTGNLHVADSISFEIIANEVSLRSDNSIFTASDVGRYVMGRLTSGVVYLKIDTVTSGISCNTTLINQVPRNKRTGKYENNGSFKEIKLGAWYEGNYPRTVAKYEQRRIYAGTFKDQNFVFMSRAGEEKSFQPTQDDGEVLDTDSISYKLDNKNAAVRWLNSTTELVIGTTGGIYRIKPNEYQYGVSPKTVRIELVEEEPCEHQGVSIGSSIFYPDESGTRILEYRYDSSITTPASNDASKLIYPTFLNDRVVRMDYQHAPQPRIWAVTQSGIIYCLSYHRQEEFYAWSKQTISGGGKVIDICVMHNATKSNTDHVWVVVKRNNKIYFEALEEADLLEENHYKYLDSFIEIKRDGAADISVDVSSRFEEGDVVSVVQDGVFLGTQTVTANDEITISDTSTTDHLLVGYSYTGELDLMFPTWNGANKPAYGAEASRVISIKPFLINSFEYEVGVDGKREVVSLAPNRTVGNGYTGFDKERPINGSFYGADKVTEFRHSKPYPLTIASVLTKTDLI